ncbi:MAG: FtsX-like permease family protein, partial [Bacteroidales bacterium]
DSLLKHHYPTISGSRVMLVDGPAAQADTIRQTLESLLPDYGLTAETASERLAAFYSVTNIYLTVFMMLGAFGLLIGTIGLGIIILRNILERKQEYALYRAIGLRKNLILRIVVAEYLFVLLAGVLLGLLAGLTGILPSLSSPSYTLPATYLILLIVVILFNGLFWIWLPARQSLRQAITPVLQMEG